MVAEENAGDALTLGAHASGAARLGIGFGWMIVELAPDGILVSDDDGRIMMANRHIEEMFGHSCETLVGAPVESLLPERLRGAHVTHRARYETAPALRPMGVGLELLGCHADGSEFPIEVSLSPVATEQGLATVVVIRDVTEQRALEREAREASALDHNERIAVDLHDRVIGHLFGCGLTLASVLGRNQLDEGITERLHDVLEEIDTVVQEIRNAVFARLAHEPKPRRVGCLDPEISAALHTEPDRDRSLPAIGNLTPTETEVLRQIALGHTNVEIAEILAKSLRTIEGHRARIQRKVDARTRAELVRVAWDAGLLVPADHERGATPSS